MVDDRRTQLFSWDYLRACVKEDERCVCGVTSIDDLALSARGITAPTMFVLRANGNKSIKAALPRSQLLPTAAQTMRQTKNIAFSFAS